MQKPAVNVMVKAARAGGNVLLRHMHRLDAINVIEKDRFDYASEVDSLAEAEIIKELKRANPDYAILGEEGGKQKAIRDGGRVTRRARPTARGGGGPGRPPARRRPGLRDAA